MYISKFLFMLVDPFKCDTLGLQKEKKKEHLEIAELKGVQHVNTGKFKTSPSLGINREEHRSVE